MFPNAETATTTKISTLIKTLTRRPSKGWTVPELTDHFYEADPYICQETVRRYISLLGSQDLLYVTGKRYNFETNRPNQCYAYIG